MKRTLFIERATRYNFSKGKGVESLLCQRLKELRISHGKTQQDVAAVLNISRSAYALYETGKRELNYGSLAALAEFYGVSLDSLFCRSEVPEPLGSFSPEERLLLERYREMDPRGRRLLSAMADLECELESDRH